MRFELQPPSGRVIVQRAKPPAERTAITLLTLEPDECHFPMGEPCGPDTLFCGDAQAKGQPYCHAHCRVAYNGFGG